MKASLEVPMAVLALLLGGLLLAPLIVDLSPATERSLDAIGWLVWGVFVFEYLVLFYLAPDRWAMVRSHPGELIMILLPMLRPLRVLGTIRLFVGVSAGFATVRAVLDRRGIRWFSLFVMVVVGLGALATMAFERQAPGGQILTVGDSLWWAIVTSTTVGYGDLAPVSSGGRAVAVVLMLVGISIFSVVTANIASYFVDRDAESDTVRIEA